MASFHLLAPVQPNLSNRRLRLVAGMALAALLAGCMTPTKSPFALGGVDPNSAVAGEVRAASGSPGSFPKFTDFPVMPVDVRSASAWKAAVMDETTLKHETEAQAAAIPFTLTGTDAWADKTRARVLAQYSQQAPADARAQAEAFAAQAAARATPPPAPK